MDKKPISYALSSLAPEEINSKFYLAKKKFELLYSHPKLNDKDYVLKNLAHLTLLAQFLLNDHTNEADSVQKLNEIKFEPIPIIGEEIDVFHTPNHGNIVVIKIQKNTALQKLHNNICKNLQDIVISKWPQFEGDKYTPHMSVLYNVPDDKVNEAKDYVRQNILPVSYSMTSFMFLKDREGIRAVRTLIKTYKVES